MGTVYPGLRFASPWAIVARRFAAEVRSRKRLGCGFTGGSFQAEYGGRLNKWDEAERAELITELDAAFFHLYGFERDDVEYILSTFKGIHERQPLFAGGCSAAERIVQKYAETSFAG